jgi:hypothetical protein
MAVALASLATIAACAPDHAHSPVALESVQCRTWQRTGEGAPETLTWVLPADSAQRVVLDAFCAGVGPALAYGAGGARSDGTGAADTVPAAGLVVVAWNVLIGNADVPGFIHDLRSGRFTDGRPVTHFVLLLQELPRLGPPVPTRNMLPAGVQVSERDPHRGPYVQELARQAGLHAVYAPSKREGLDDPPLDDGTAILSTLPLTDARVMELAPGIGRRVAVSARLNVPGSALHGINAVSAHLDNFSFGHFRDSFGRIRGRQARSLAAALPDGATILGADLNTWLLGEREAAAVVLRARLRHPAELQPHGTARRLGLPRRLDYLMADLPPGWRLETRRLPRYGSDHNPILGILQPADTAAYP